MPDDGIEVRSNLTISEELLNKANEDAEHSNKWRKNLDDVHELRLGARRNQKLSYVGAPNFHEPIIDEQITRATAQENRILWLPKYIAHFIPLSPKASEFKSTVEIAFHYLISLTLKARQKISLLLDTKNEMGYSLAFMTINQNAYRHVIGSNHILPDFVYEHPYNVLFPTSTKSLQDAQRFVRIIPYNVQTFRRIAKEKQWANVEEVVRKVREFHADDGNNFSIETGYHPRIGLNRSHSSQSIIPVHEGYYHDSQGRKRVVIYSPVLPAKPLKDFSWEWADDNSPRRWPIVEFRREDRAQELMDTRGIGELTKDNQLAATTFKNLQATVYDYTAFPMFRGGNTFSMNNFNPRPGVQIPEGMELVQFGGLDESFQFSLDQERQSAARRVGSDLGSGSSQTGLKDPITATESNRQALNADMITLDGVSRFTEPLSLIFSMMWEYLQHHPVPLPVFDDNLKFQDELDTAVYNEPYLVMAAANSRNSDPIFVLNQLLGLLQFLANNPTIDQSRLMKFVVNQIDPVLADQIVVNTNQGSTLEQSVVQLAQQVQGIAQIVQENRQFITAQAEEDIAGQNQNLNQATA